MGRVRATRRGDQGFSLVEVMVVVVVLGTLVMISLPTFVGASTTSRDAVAKANLRTAVLTARTVAVETGDFSAITPQELEAREPSLSFRTARSRGPDEVSIRVQDVRTGRVRDADARVTIAALSDSGRCFIVRTTLIERDGVATTEYQEVAGAARCRPADAVEAFWTEDGW